MSDSPKRVKCSNAECSAVLKLPATAKRGRCPRCGTMIEVGSESVIPAAAKSAKDSETIPLAISEEMKCPSCKALLARNTQRCPACGHSFSKAVAPRKDDVTEWNESDELPDDVDALIKTAKQRWKRAETEWNTPIPIESSIRADLNGFRQRAVMHRAGKHKECINPACSSPGGKWQKEQKKTGKKKQEWELAEDLSPAYFLEEKRDALLNSDEDEDDWDSHDNERIALVLDGVSIKEWWFCKDCRHDLYDQLNERKQRINDLLTAVGRKLCEAIDSGEEDQRLREVLRQVQSTLIDAKLPYPKPKSKWWKFWK